jgi:hypothetical protein
VAVRTTTYRKLTWQQKRIALEKAQARAELNARGDPRSRLEHALARVAELEDDISAVGLLRRYVFIVSALVHHGRHGGLSDLKVRRLKDLALAILRPQMHGPRVTQAWSLFAELKIILGQAYARRGMQWRAAWEQAFAARFARAPRSRAADDGAASGVQPGFQAYTCGVQALRLGHVSLALASFDEAEREGVSAPVALHLGLRRAKALRLAGRTDESRERVRELARRPGVGEAMRLELAWEELAVAAQETGDVRPLATAVQRRGAHFRATYVLEAHLWAAATRGGCAPVVLPSVRSRAARTSLALREQDFLYKCVLQLVTCQDPDVTLELRVEGLGQVLARLSRLVSVDKELLVRAAAARWLASVPCDALAALARADYRALSLTLTDGARDDALGLLGDLLRPKVERCA